MTDTLAELDRRHALHPFTPLAAHRESEGPFVIERGAGVHVFDDRGNRYIEGMSGLWCASLGFSEPRLAAAAARQFEALPYSHLFSHRSTVPAIELSAKLAALAPEGLERVFLVNSGSEAIDVAIKMVWYVNNALGRPGKKTIIARRRAYHGVTVAAGSLTGLPYAQDGFDLPAIPVIHVETPVRLPGRAERRVRRRPTRRAWPTSSRRRSSRPGPTPSPPSSPSRSWARAAC